MTNAEMTARYQCPGCVCGSDTNCGKYKPADGGACEGHVLGTSFGLGNPIALGMPRGFNKPGLNFAPQGFHGKFEWWRRSVLPMRFFADGKPPEWNNLNVPVWAMEHEGALFVRTYSPRIDSGSVDIIPGGTLTMCPQAINVAEFVDEID